MLESIVTVIYVVIGIGSIAGSVYIARDRLVGFAEDFSVVQSSTESTIGQISNTVEKKNISGIAEKCKETVRSPLRERECLAYESIIENTTGFIKSTIYEDESKVQFKLRDGSDSLLVETNNADLYLEKDIAPINLESVRSILSQEAIGQVSVRDVSAKEGHIKSGDSVFIYGDIKSRTDAEEGSVISTTTDGEMVISNMPGGQIKGHLLKMLVSYGAVTAFLFLSGFVVIFLGLGLF